MIEYHKHFDTREEADDFVEGTYEAWHPAGYGTRLTIYTEEDGTFTVRGYRGTTAD